MRSSLYLLLPLAACGTTAVPIAATTPIAPSATSTIVPATPQPLREVAAPAAIRIAGRATVDGKPAAIALALVGMDGAPPQQLSSGADGRFDFGLQRDSAWTLVATADGAAPTAIDLTPADAGELEVRLASCYRTLAGTIRDEHGEPVAGAELRLGALDLPVARAGDDGAYALCVGDTSRLVVRAAGHGPLAVAVDVRGDQRRDLVLPGGQRLEIRVIGDDGLPLAGAHVLAMQPQVASLAITGADGRVADLALAPEDTVVLVEPSWAARHGVMASGAATRSLGGPVDEVVLYATSGASLHGVVEDGERPLPGVTVIWDGPRGELATVIADDDGRFVVPAAKPGGQFRVLGGYRVDDIDEDAELLEDVVHVSRARAVIGTVVEDGRPVAGARVTAGSGYPEVTTRADGSFMIPVESTGPLPLHARSGATRSAGDLTVDVAADGNAGVVIELDDAGSVAGVVVDRDGQPLAELAVELDDHHGNRGSALTGPDGHFVIDGLAGGEQPYRIQVHSAFDLSQWLDLDADVLERRLATLDDAFTLVDDDLQILIADGHTLVTGVRVVVQRTSDVPAPPRRRRAHR